MSNEHLSPREIPLDALAKLEPAFLIQQIAGYEAMNMVVEVMTTMLAQADPSQLEQPTMVQLVAARDEHKRIADACSGEFNRRFPR